MFSIILLVFVLGSTTSAVRIGSFNLHQYGPEKVANTTVTKVTAEIINEFDLAVVQEITDVSCKAPYVLHEALNLASGSHPYSMTISERVGRSNIKEQYIFFNRLITSGVAVVNAYTYNDTRDDRFERPP
jgi:hypothetical protein